MTAAATTAATTTYRLLTEKSTGRIVKSAYVNCGARAAASAASAEIARVKGDFEYAYAQASKDYFNRFEIQERVWTPELADELGQVFEGVHYRPRATKPYPFRAPRASGKPSTELRALRRYLSRLWSNPDHDRLAAALVADIDAAIATWEQPTLI